MVTEKRGNEKTTNWKVAILEPQLKSHEMAFPGFKKLKKSWVGMKGKGSLTLKFFGN